MRRESTTRHRRGPAKAARGWRVLVPLSALLAGVMFAASAETSAGTDLRAGRRLDLTQLIRNQERAVAALDGRLATVQADVADLQERAGAGDSDVAAAQSSADALAPAVGLTPFRGPGLQVSLDDAPTTVDGTLPIGARANDVVVHQADVQAVVNALWAGGADAVTLMGERIIATSAVRCVGNTLLLHGRTYSPPFVVAAIGAEDRMRTALDASPNVELFRDAATAFGLGYDVSDLDTVDVPAYEGPLGVTVALEGD